MFEGVRAVVFDLDNTLVVRRMTLRRMTQYINRFYFSERPAEHEKIASLFCECFRSGYTDLRECYEEFRRRSAWDHKADFRKFRAMWDFYYPFCTCREPDAEIVLTLRDRGYRIGILTNGTSVLQQGKVDVVGFRDWFEFVIATEEIGVDKPDPFPFRFIARKMGLREDEIVYVGDHPENDIEAARLAGLHTIWFSAYAGWDERFRRAELEITALPQLLELFR